MRGKSLVILLIAGCSPPMPQPYSAYETLSPGTLVMIQDEGELDGTPGNLPLIVDGETRSVLDGSTARVIHDPGRPPGSPTETEIQERLVNVEIVESLASHEVGLQGQIARSDAMALPTGSDR